MVVITLTDVPPSLRGDLTKWLFEINVGVYVGQISARVRDELWNRIVKNAKVGRVTMIYQTNNEQHFAYRIHNSAWKPIDFDGLTLMMRPHAETPQSSRLNPGFSNAAHRRMARRIQKAEMIKPKPDDTQYINDKSIDPKNINDHNSKIPDKKTDSVAIKDTPNESSSNYSPKISTNDSNAKKLTLLPLKSSVDEIDLGYMMQSIRISERDNYGKNKTSEKINQNDRNLIKKNHTDIQINRSEPSVSSQCTSTIFADNSANSYVVIDLETTGLDETEDEIIEFGAIRIQNSQISGKFQRIVFISNDISPFITKLTGITNEMIDDQGKQLTEVLEDFLTFIGHDTLVGHNIAFDIKFINAALKRANRPPIANNTKCTYELSKLLLPSLKSRKLQSIAEALNINSDGLHRALNDCLCVFGIYEHMLNIISCGKMTNH
jgi:CRISPR-associated endoribonuclease Cas2 subtype I-E